MHDKTERRRMSAPDVWQLRRFGAPAIVPGGDVVVGMTTFDVEANEGRDTIYRVPSEGGEPRQLTAEHSSSQPVISPCGKRLAFVRTVSGSRPQLYIMPLDGGEARRLTNLP